MGTRINTQFLLVAATLGVILGAFTAPAQADPVASFTVSANTIVLGESVIATDTSSNPEGKELTYEWATAPVGSSSARSNGPECLNAACSQVRFTYSGVGEAGIGLKITWPGSPGYGSTFSQTIKVVDASEAPAPILLNGPTTVSLPTVLDVMSPKPHMRLGTCSQAVLRGTNHEYCEPYLVKRVGPDSSGLYHFRWRFVMSEPGEVEVAFSAWNKAANQFDYQAFTLNVTGNAFIFGDVRSCYWPTFINDKGLALREKIQMYELGFYSKKDVRVTLRLQEKRSGRWVYTRRKRTEVFSSTNSTNGQSYAQARHKLMHVTFGPRTNKRRVVYRIRTKNGRKLLKQGYLSKRNCAVPFRV